MLFERLLNISETLFAAARKSRRRSPTRLLGQIQSNSIQSNSHWDIYIYTYISSLATHIISSHILSILSSILLDTILYTYTLSLSLCPFPFYSIRFDSISLKSVGMDTDIDPSSNIPIIQHAVKNGCESNGDALTQLVGEYTWIDTYIAASTIPFRLLPPMSSTACMLVHIYLVNCTHNGICVYVCII
jgi:hypothetical protein